MKKINFALVKDYNFYSVFARNAVLIATVFLLPLILICTYIMSMSENMVNNEVDILLESEARVITEQVEALYSDTYATLQAIALDEDVVAFINDYQGYREDKVKGIKAIESGLNNAKLVRNYVTSFAVYSVLTQECFVSYDDERAKWNVDEINDIACAQENAQTILFIPREDISYPVTLSVIMPIVSSDAQILGYVVANLDMQQVAEAAVGNGGNIGHLSVFHNGVLAYSENKNLLFEEKSNVLRSFEEEQIWTKADRWNFEIAYVKNISAHQQRIDQMLQNSLKIILFAVVLSIVGVWIVSYKTYQPLRQIIKALMQIEKSEDFLHGTTERKTQNETKYIINSIMASEDKNKDLGEQLKTRIKLLNEAQMANYQAQITPHFVYNTLDTFKWQAMELSGGRNELSDSIARFSKLLHISIDSQEKLVPLSEEVEHARLYINLLELRYKDKFSFAWKMEDGCERYMIPKLSLQPLIENAVYHGIKPKEGAGLIELCGYVDGSQLKVRVRDDGIGIDEENLQRLRHDIDNTTYTSSEHIGVRNVNQRIKLIFGDMYGLTIESQKAAGTDVTVVIPVVEN